MKSIIVLGSTGSIGRQTLEVAARHSIRVEAICAGNSVDLLEEQARTQHVKYAALSDRDAAEELTLRLSDTPVKVFVGREGILKMISECESDMSLNAIVGRAGLLPSIASLECGKKLALANMESLVCAGSYVMALAKEKNLPVLPVDSEHSAVWQSLHAGHPSEVTRLILTASGGPFFGKKKEELSHMTVDEALAHPTWSMGKKITIDSATMMNKGFEIIEAAHLFGMPPEKIDVLVHRESIVHSMVEFCDGAVIAELGVPDMRTCISLALSYPDRFETFGKRLDLAKIGTLSFYEPDNEAFPQMNLAREAFREGGMLPAILNAADEAATALFLDRRISFGEIGTILERAVQTYPNVKDPSVSFMMEESDRIEKEILRKY